MLATPEIAPQVEVPENIELRYLTPEILTAAQFFDSDIAEVEADVSTLDNPIVVRYYEQGWRQWD